MSAPPEFSAVREGFHNPPVGWLPRGSIEGYSLTPHRGRARLCRLGAERGKNLTVFLSF
jgi:hypothetical protein